MPVESTYINTLYQANDGSLYIGTNGSGVLIYNPKNRSFEHYYADNSALFPIISILFFRKWMDR